MTFHEQFVMYNASEHHVQGMNYSTINPHHAFMLQWVAFICPCEEVQFF